jgi:hypothetical protein
MLHSNALACVNIPMHSSVMLTVLNLSTIAVIEGPSAQAQSNIHIGKFRSIALANWKTRYGRVEVSNGAVFCLSYLHFRYEKKNTLSHLNVHKHCNIYNT